VPEGVEAFDYLWTTEREDWVVLRSESSDPGLPYNRTLRQILLIDENDELAVAVVRRMIDEGLPVTDRPE
jgi:hypothetical protein